MTTIFNSPSTTQEYSSSWNVVLFVFLLLVQKSEEFLLSALSHFHPPEPTTHIVATMLTFQSEEEVG